MGDQLSNSFADMCITSPWCDAVTNMDYGNDNTLDDFEQELRTNNFVVVTDSNSSNISANVIHDMQVYRTCFFCGPTNYEFFE